MIEGPLEAGAPSRAPFDVIVIEGAFKVRPEALLAQLAENGRLVGVDAMSGTPQAVLCEKNDGAFSRRALVEASADLLDGFEPVESFVF